MNKRTCSIVLALGLVVSGVIAGPATAGKKKKPKPKVCTAFQPGELGAEAETVVVTDAHTAEAPLLHAFSLDMAFDEGVNDVLNEEAGTPLPGTPHHYVNIQVDSKAATAGLYVTWEFDSNRDYDLWAYNADGTEAASAHGFQPLIATEGQPEPADQSNTGTNHAGHSTATTENIVGLITNDCGGYTIDTATYFGEGGDFELKIWLGEGTTAPGVPE
ncbi:MAG TPA: hypothetical protein VEV43_06305 [Actinomycetota bacterium]|nr:hypothetical protein [Actinomycetota bacterium]